ncbi:unnamed protein product [Meganyctiphanes norvegica]|uniref:Uncharacterized protein n=1 Tax=Meganyctiphanes norvegica TaxID=48144 RepID=A0AAV2QW53_MEGNR
MAAAVSLGRKLSLPTDITLAITRKRIPSPSALSLERPLSRTMSLSVQDGVTTDLIGRRSRSPLPRSIEECSTFGSTNLALHPAVRTSVMGRKRRIPIRLEFKSYVSGLNNQLDIQELLGNVLEYQSQFITKTSPWEESNWNKSELKSFSVDITRIDRLYCLNIHNIDDNTRAYEMSCRMDYNGTKVFAVLVVKHKSWLSYAASASMGRKRLRQEGLDEEGTVGNIRPTSIVAYLRGSEFHGSGHIIVTKLPNFFLNNLLHKGQNLNNVFVSLLDDGYLVDEPDEFNNVHASQWKNVPMLKFLTHITINNHKDKLLNYKEQLPKVLASSVEEFIKIKEWIVLK